MESKMVYKVSEITKKKIKTAKEKGFKIKQTTDSKFLTRRPKGRKDMMRTGSKLGTGGGSHTSTTIFAYKEKKKK